MYQLTAHNLSSIPTAGPAQLVSEEACSFPVLPCCAMPHADPYLNMDAGTMSPFEHGEVFVLDDGGEVRALSGSAASHADMARWTTQTLDEQRAVLTCSMQAWLQPMLAVCHTCQLLLQWLANHINIACHVHTHTRT